MPRQPMAIQITTHLDETIAAIIRSAGSRIGSVAFVKEDGTLRHLRFQTATRDASPRLAGTELGERMSRAFKANNPDKLRLWDIDKGRADPRKGWRTVTLPRVVAVRVNGASFRFRDPDAVRAAVLALAKEPAAS